MRLTGNPGRSAPGEAHLVADIVYMPLNTALLDLARGCLTLNGGGMASHIAEVGHDGTRRKAHRNPAPANRRKS